MNILMFDEHERFSKLDSQFVMVGNRSLELSKNEQQVGPCDAKVSNFCALTESKNRNVFASSDNLSLHCPVGFLSAQGSY